MCSPQCVCGNKEQEERGGGDIGDWYNGKRKGWGQEEGGGSRSREYSSIVYCGASIPTGSPTT